jgi:cytochrome c-type biogenesis protein
MILDFSYALAFLGGILSILSPCLLPVLPGYMGYIAGVALTSNTEKSKRTITLHAIAFSLGFAIVMMMIGGIVGSIGGQLKNYQEEVTRIGGILLIMLGIHMTGVIQWKKLLEEKKLFTQKSENKNHTLAHSLITGVIFGTSWTPCIGPILGSIATIAGIAGGLEKGILLFAVYSAGFSIPLIIIALLTSIVGKKIKSIERYAQKSSLIAGTILIVIGTLLLTGVYQKITAGLEKTPFTIEEKITL